MGIQYLLPWLYILADQPAVKINWLLGWVDPFLIEFLVSLLNPALINALSLQHSIPHVPEHADGIMQAAESYLTVRETVGAIALVPYDSPW